jgi:hypothetical protein
MTDRILSPRRVFLAGAGALGAGAFAGAAPGLAAEPAVTAPRALKLAWNAGAVCLSPVALPAAPI